MRIVLDGTSCAKPRRGGIGTYGAALVAALRRVAPEHELVVALRPQRWRQRELVTDLLAGERARLLLDRLNPLSLGGPIDVFHGLGVRLPVHGSFPRVVTLHDLNVFEFPKLAGEHWRTTRQARIRQVVARADLLLSYSEQGAAALERYLHVAREHVRVVPLGIDVERFAPAAPEPLRQLLDRLALGDKPYLLSVGEYSTRKNPHGLLAAFAASGLAGAWRLVIAGPRDAHARALANDARRLGLPDDALRLPGWVDDNDLPTLISGASIYVCAALHEGFGLPVLEAQACGTAVAASDRGALPETLGDVGLLFDPGQREQFVATLLRLADDEALRDDFARRGRPRVMQHFTWDRVARDTLAVYRELAGS